MSKVTLILLRAEPFPNAPKPVAKNSGSSAAEVEVKRQHVKWDPLIKAQALALCKKRGGEYSAAVKALQADEVLNASGVYNRLTPGKFSDWQDISESQLLHETSERRLPMRMASLIEGARKLRC